MLGIRLDPNLDPKLDRVLPARARLRRTTKSELTRGPFRRLAAESALCLTLLIAIERPARADDALAIVGAVGVAALVAVDVTFGVYDIKVASEHALPTRAWSIAESVVGLPQALALDAVVLVGFSNWLDDSGATAMLGLRLLPMALHAMSGPRPWS